MRQSPKPAKAKPQGKPSVPTPTSSKNAGARVRELEKRLAEALQHQAEALQHESGGLGAADGHQRDPPGDVELAHRHPARV